MTFRVRLLVVSLASLAVGLGALVLTGNVLLDHRVKGERSTLLREQAQAQIAALDISGGRIRLRDTANDPSLDRRAWVIERGGRVLERPPNSPAGLDRQAVHMGRQGRNHEAAAAEDAYLLARVVLPRGGGPVLGTVVVARSTDQIELLQKEVLVGSVAVAALILIASGLIIRSAIEGALEPVAQMTARARDWSEHDLDRRFDLGAPRDEITGLAAMLDRMLGRIASSRRHDQRFASEVAHELRTPIAGLRGRAELALTATGPGADVERREALASVIEQVDRVQAAVDALLAEARGETDGRPGSTDIAALLAEYDDIAAAVPPDLPPVEGEQELVRRALAPLVDNARRHARSTVSFDVVAANGHVAVAVLDDGDGVPARDAEAIFQPGARGADSTGAGLGLPLARRLARSCGGDVVVEPGDGGGRFVLTLPLA